MRDDRENAAWRELRDYPFFAHGGDTFDRLSGFAQGNQGGTDKRCEVEFSIALSSRTPRCARSRSYYRGAGRAAQPGSRGGAHVKASE